MSYGVYFVVVFVWFLGVICFVHRPVEVAVIYDLGVIELSVILAGLKLFSWEFSLSAFW